VLRQKKIQDEHETASGAVMKAILEKKEGRNEQARKEGRREEDKKKETLKKKKSTNSILQEFFLVTGGSVYELLRCCSGKESACQCRR